ncbi:chaperone protein DnaJ 49 [Tanacetum coccineum]
MGQFVQLQPVSHDQHLNNSNASYEDFKATIPSPLIDKDLFASYPEQSESRNPCSNHVIQKLLVYLIISVFSILYMWFVIYVTHTDPYSPDGDFIYKHHLKTNQYGIDYYVKSGFDKKYPIGSPERAELEKSINNDYLDSLQSECHDELWGKWTSLHPHDYSTPNCDELKSMDVKIIPFSSMIED